MAPSPSHSEQNPRHAGALLVLFFVSGFAALVYQVLWVRELGLLFGSTAQSAALTIAIFFAGIALGGWFWGRRAGRLKCALRGFALLEVGVAVTALGHFVLVDAYHAVYPALHALTGHAPVLETLLKAVVATTILLPPAFLMGGTLPLMGQHLIRRGDRLAATGSLLYAVNTLGAASGALAAGFVLPLALGFTWAYLLAVVLDLAVGLSAVLLSWKERTNRAPAPAPTPRSLVSPVSLVSPHDSLPAGMVWGIAFVSGFATLGVEVLWTRLFSQVLQNSAYTYALVLATFLLALSLGAGLANLLSRQSRFAPEHVLGGLLALSALAAATSPWLFHELTGGMTYVGARMGWSGYVMAVAVVAVSVMLLPGTVLGAVLPYLLRILKLQDRTPGEAIGRLIAANTTGAILGSLSTGFLLLPLLGTARALLFLAALYVLLAGLFHLRAAPLPNRPGLARLSVAGTAAVVAFVLLTVTPQSLQGVRLDTERGERLIAMREGTQAHVAVIERPGSRVLRVNNYYTLGGTGALDSERNQSLIPLLVHPDPRSVFFLGMGTGITAGAALSFPGVERVVICELLSDVIAMAERHFTPWTNGLFEDARVRIHAEDGRNCLRRSEERFDVVISDLFTPWKAGTGNLYTLEHFRTARARLNPGGLFVQWIPLYQVSEREFGIIARTMTEAFPQVLLWRGDLYPSRSIIALIGQAEPAPLDPGTPVRQARTVNGDPTLDDALLQALVLRYYGGNVSAGGLFNGHALNTDAMPLIEYLAPRTHRSVIEGRAEWMVGEVRDRMYTALLDAAPVARDPYLSSLDDRQKGYVEAGLSYSRHRALSTQGRRDLGRPHLESFIALSPPGSTRTLSPANLLMPTTQSFVAR